MPRGSYRKLLTEEQKTQILKMYVDDKVSMNALRSKLKISIKRIRQFLVDENVFRSEKEMVMLRNKAIALSFTNAEKKDIVTKFNKGVSVLKITKEYQCTYVPIYNLLLDEGVDLMNTYCKHSEVVQRLVKARG